MNCGTCIQWNITQVIKKEMSYQAMNKHGGTLSVYCEMKEDSLKVYILYDCNHMAFWKRQNYGNIKKISVSQGFRKREKHKNT